MNDINLHTSGEIAQAEPETIKASPVLHPELQSHIDFLEHQIDRVKSMGPALDLAIALEKRFPQYMRRSIEPSGGRFFVYFQFTAIAEAVEMLRFLAQEKDVHQKGKPFSGEDDKSMNWSFEKLFIVGYFKGGQGANCAFVQVGVKEVPVYELKCSDESASALPAPMLAVARPALAIDDGMPF